MFSLSFTSIGYEIRRLISISNMRNNSATRKNWNENGMWGGVSGVNPHSNCLHFSL
jgi:hypothetical protein